MCTKTKNSYGCGHCAKIFEPCNVRGCEDVAKYKMPPKNSDCARCKAGGEAVTRGMEGRGRYAREIHTRRSSSDSYTPSSPVAVPHMTISPWAANEQSQPNEKRWNTPTRQKADDAWVVEHERRMSDLDDKSVKKSSHSRRESFRSSRRPSPNSSYERIIEAVEFEEPEEMETSTRAPVQMLPYEISEDSDLSRSRHRPRQSGMKSDRIRSHNTAPVPVIPQQRRRLMPAASERDADDSMQLVHRPRRHGPKTEPYPSYQDQTCFFDSPISGSPIASGPWNTQYQVSSGPTNYDTHYPRAYVPAVH